MADSPAHVLVVEDDPSLRKLLQVTLSKAGYRVTIAENGLEGLVLIDKAHPKPDLLIVDVMMPELDGLSLLKALKTHKATRGIPVMLVTAKADSRSFAEGISAGAKYYVTKPFVLDELLAKVKKAIG